MSLLFIDGFDHYGSGTNPASVGKWATVNGGGNTVTTANFRTGTGAMRLTSSTASIVSKIFTTSGGAIIGFAFYGIGPFTAVDLLQIQETAIVHVAIGLTTAGLLTIKRGSTVLATGTHPLSLNSWQYIEIKTIIHDTVGSYELRVDGITELSATNVDTQNAGTGVWNRILLAIAGTTAANTDYDDVYMCDTSGSAPYNDFLGPVKIDTLLPQTDAVSAGSNAGLTPSTGTDHGALVDEIPPNTTDFNSASTVGLKDTYQYPNAALTGTIVAIQTNLYVNKADAVARAVCSVVRTSSTDYDGANVSPLTTFSYLPTVFPLNPNTGVAWTTADINAIQVGMKVTV